MRIAYFADNFYPELTGIADSVLTTGEELRRRGHEVLYVAPRYAKKDYKKSGHPEREKLPIIRLPSIPLPLSPTGQSRFSFPLCTSLSRLRKWGPDIIHTQSPWGAGLEALLISRILHVPLVGTNHTPVEEFFPLPPLTRRYDAWYYNRCRLVTAPYKGLIDNMRKVGFKRTGRGQPNPVPFAASPRSVDERRACKAEFDVPGPLVLVSGRLAPEKRVEDVLHAFKKVLASIPQATLVITGHGSSESSLKELAKELAIEEHVRFVGFVPPDKLGSLYCTAEAYAIMSTAETQSLSLMQAFANGVPAVAVRARGLVDYCPPEAGFLVDIGDTEALAKHLIELLTNTELRLRMGRGGVEFVKQFTPEAVAAQWEEIYRLALLL